MATLLVQGMDVRRHAITVTLESGRLARRANILCQGAGGFGSIRGNITTAFHDSLCLAACNIPDDTNSRAKDAFNLAPEVAVRIDPINRIAVTVDIEVKPAAKPRRVLRRPPSRRRVVVPRPEPHEPRVPIPQPAGEPEGLKPRSCVVRDDSPFVVVDPLGYRSRAGVDDESRAAEMIRDEAVGCPALDHEVWGVAARAVDESSDLGACAVQLGDDAAPAVEEALREHTVNLLADTAGATVDDVLDRRERCRTVHAAEASVGVVVERRYVSAVVALPELTVRSVLEGDGAVGLLTVLSVVGTVVAVAVGVLLVLACGEHRAVLVDLPKPTSRVVLVARRLGHAADRFCLDVDAAGGVSDVACAVARLYLVRARARTRTRAPGLRHDGKRRDLT